MSAEYLLAMAELGKDARPGQLELVDRGLELQPGESLLVHAPTATGKSLAALLIAGLRAQREPVERTVISTYTKLLMDQYRDTDLADARHLFPETDFQVLKGAANYLCRHAARNLSGFGYPQLFAGSGDPGEVGGSGLWRARADALSCRKHAPDRCGFAAARERAAAADVVVTNHALTLLSGINANILGPHQMLIVDEVHNLVRAAESLAVQELDLDELGSQLYRLRGAKASKGVELLSRVLFTERDRVPTAAEIRQIITGYRALPPVASCAELTLLRDWLDAAVLRARGERVAELAVVAGQPPGPYGKRLLQLHTVDLSGITQRGLVTRFRVPLDADPEADAEDGAVRDYRRAVLMMSATVGTPERPAYVADRAGVTAELVRVPSPLDYRRSMRVSVVGDNEPWPLLAERLVRETGGRTLVLARSWWRVEQLYQHLISCGLGVEVLVQDRKSPALNRAVVARFAAAETSVLIGTASFFEGIDVPGPALSQVIIAELPVPMVTSPVQLERRRRLGAAWTEDVQVPATALVLEQMIGRLIRGVADRGLVAVLDASAAKGTGRRALVAALETYGGQAVLVPRPVALGWWRESMVALVNTMTTSSPGTRSEVS